MSTKNKTFSSVKIVSPYRMNKFWRMRVNKDAEAVPSRVRICLFPSSAEQLGICRYGSLSNLTRSGSFPLSHIDRSDGKTSRLDLVRLSSAPWRDYHRCLMKSLVEMFPWHLLFQELRAVFSQAVATLVITQSYLWSSRHFPCNS